MPLVVLDAEGADILPLCEKYSRDAEGNERLPVYILLALLKAESELDPRAERWGGWPDVSFGMAQTTVAVAGGLGIGDGSNTAENIAFVREYMLDRKHSIRAGADVLAWCWQRAAGAGCGQPSGVLVAYNSGSVRSPDNPYWLTYAGNADRYESDMGGH
ncbi:MAG: transglycosylase SLT domain-containing protein [Chloroflexi bacterium]|nr:transglycosylase SLT domain-containing protein [Chloroflexota bacterium]